MKSTTIIIIIMMFCMMSSSAAVIAAFVVWEKKWWIKTPSAAPSAATAPSVVNAPSVGPSVGPSVVNAPSVGPSVGPSVVSTPSTPVTNPGDFSLANIDYKPVGDFKADVLGTINSLRAIRNVSEPKPKKTMVPLTWDPELEAAACVHADLNAKGNMHHPGVIMKGWEIIAWHDPVTHGGIFAWWNEHTKKPNSAYPDVPTAWHCDPGNIECSDTGHMSGDLATGHYAFMSHSDATRIGCCTSGAGTWAPLVCQGK